MPTSGTYWYDLLAPMITDVNPFVYSHPLDPEDVIDRDEEARELLTHAVGGHFVRLFAPRKFGKTSLLRRVLRDAERVDVPRALLFYTRKVGQTTPRGGSLRDAERDEGMIPILVDLYGVLSVAD